MLNVIKKSAESFYADLAALTYQMCPSSRVWVDMMETWKNNPEFDGCDVLLDAIHKVMWGFAPDVGYSPAYLKFIDAVAAVMENCDEAVEAWRTTGAFISTRDYIAETAEPITDDDEAIYRHTIIHYHYLRSRMLCKLEFEREFCTDPDVLASEFWRNYETAVTELIPSAASWTRAQWGDENNIHDALSAAFRVDYRENADEFDRVIQLKMHLNDGNAIDSEAAAWYAMNTTQFSYSLAEAFWPDNTKEWVRKLFVSAVKFTLDYERKGRPDFQKKDRYIHATGVFDRIDLLASWMYKLCYEWYIKGIFAGEERAELKKAIFDIAVQ